MKGFVIVDRGLEEIAELEISELIKTKSILEDSVVIFDLKEEIDLCKIAYSAQSIRRALLFIDKITIQNLEQGLEEFMKLDLKQYSNKKLKIECERFGEHNFNSVDFAQEISGSLHKSGFNISGKNYDLIMYIYIFNDKAYVGIDYSGRDLSKRTHRLFTKAGSLKGTLANAVVRFSDYKPGEIIIDPWCETGIIPIEAALFASKKSSHFYKKDFEFEHINPDFAKVFAEEDKKIVASKNIYAYDKLLGNINSTKKNAQAAGVDKDLNFSKTDIEWLDTKFEKQTVDKIITKLPSESKNKDKKLVEKIYKEFFYQAEFILKKTGLLTVCSLKNESLKEAAEKRNFKVVKEKHFFSGQQKHLVTVFGF